MTIDETTKIYEVTLNQYRKLLKDDLKEIFLIETTRLEIAMNPEGKEISKNIKLD